MLITSELTAQTFELERKLEKLLVQISLITCNMLLGISASLKLLLAE